MKLVSMRRFGEMHGVTAQAVTKWKKRGLLVFEGDKVNVEASNANLKRYRSAGLTGSQATKDDYPRQLVDLLIAGLEADIDLTGISMTVEDITMTIVEPGFIKESYLALKKAKRLGTP